MMIGSAVSTWLTPNHEVSQYWDLCCSFCLWMTSQRLSKTAHWTCAQMTPPCTVKEYCGWCR